MGAIRLPSNGTLKTKEKETRNLIVRAMPFILNFHTQMSSSQLKERKIFFHSCINGTTSQNPERCFFFTHEKNDTSKQSHSSALIWCQNSRFLYDLAAPSLSELLRSLSKRKFIVPRNESFFS